MGISKMRYKYLEIYFFSIFFYLSSLVNAKGTNNACRGPLCPQQYHVDNCICLLAMSPRPWGACTKPCGGGVRTRSWFENDWLFHCDDCFETESCNPHPCPKWEA